MTFTTTTTTVNGEKRFQIIDNRGTKYDVRSKDAALDIISGLLEGSRASVAAEAPKRIASRMPSAAEIAEFGSFAGSL